MKRLLCILPLLGCLAGPGTTPAQNLVNDAARQELEDKLRRAERDLEALKESNESLRRKLTALDSALNEISRLSAERDRANNNILKLTASKDELHQLERALKESEQRRDADKKLFLEKFEELRKVIAAAPAAPAFTPTPPKPGKEKTEPSSSKKNQSANVPDTGVYHTVEKNQTALEILKAYNDDQKAKGHAGKITLRQLEAANPGADMNKLRAGQKLFIPIPDK
jgi:DNA repair exonuclease SbcCD ATPase subunit